MINLSQNDCNIIAEHFLNKYLNQLRDALERAKQKYELNFLFHHDVVNDVDSNSQKIISRLLYILQSHEAALDLRSKIESEDIASELFALFRHIWKGNFIYEHYRALSRLVVKQVSDVDIWNVVFDLIITVSRTISSTSISVFFDDTSITSSFVLQQGDEQTQKLVKERIFEKIRRCTHQNVESFFSKYFEEKSWTERTKEIYKIVQERHVNERWTDFSQSSIQNAVCEWWFHFQDEFLLNEWNVYYTSNIKDLTSFEAKRQINLFIKLNNEKLSKIVHDWKNVEVIEELKEFNKNKKATLLQIARYVRDVFFCQLTRRYVHAFTLCENDMQTWVFDRSDSYSSTAFDIHEKSECFIRTIAAYVMISDEELSLDTFIERDDDNRFIIVVKDATSKKRRLQLKPILIAHQRAIVCRDTSCFRVRTSSFKNLQYVAKFSWVFDKRRSKVDLLRLAREREVKRVVKLFDYHRIISIANMRERLTFEKSYSFRNTTLSSAFFFSQSQSLLPQLFGSICSLGIAEDFSKKRKSIDAEESSFKRSRFNSQSSDKVKRNKKVNSQTTSLYTHDDSLFDNRIFDCLMILSVDRAIQNFRSILELLKTLCDAIKAHRSLYRDGKILHRDILKNNIIITDSKKTDDFMSMLIDENLVKKIGSERSDARHQTGMMKFLMIQVLQRVAHTYRHNLESFFYVLLWICAHRAWKREFLCSTVDRLRESMLSEWYTSSFKKIAWRKEYAMSVNEFEQLLNELSLVFDHVKPLCKKIRGILFSLLKNEALFIETSSNSPEKLYHSIIEAFDSAIVNIAAEDDLE